jgi:ParB family chromosome partitioning protein
VEESAPVAEAALVEEIEPIGAELVAAAAVAAETQPEALQNAVAIEIIVENAAASEPGLTPDIREALEEIFGDQIAAENAPAAVSVESTEAAAETPAAPEVVTEAVAVEETAQAEVVVIEAPLAPEVAEVSEVETSTVETAAETAGIVPTRDAQAWNELGNTHLATGAYDDAISAYIKAIETDDKLGVAYNNLALGYTLAGKSAEAVLLYQKMIDILSRPDATSVVWELPHKAAVETKPAEAQEEAWPVFGLHEIAIDAIYPNPRQPRMDIDVEELTASIRAHGFIQPLVVSPNGTRGKYILIAGHRRLEAARQAGFGKVPVIVRAANEQQHLELALVENAQRVDLNPLELAEAYRQLAEEFEMTHEEIALRVGKSRASVSNTLRLLKLSDKVKMALMEERITEGHARALIPLTTPQAQNVALQHLLANSLSVRQTEEWVRKALGEKTMYPPEESELEIVNQNDVEKEEDKLSSASLLKRARSLLLSNRSVEQPTFSYRHAS